MLHAKNFNECMEGDSMKDVTWDYYGEFEVDSGEEHYHTACVSQRHMYLLGTPANFDDDSSIVKVIALSNLSGFALSNDSLSKIDQGSLDMLLSHAKASLSINGEYTPEQIAKSIEGEMDDGRNFPYALRFVALRAQGMDEDSAHGLAIRPEDALGHLAARDSYVRYESAPPVLAMDFDL